MFSSEKRTGMCRVIWVLMLVASLCISTVPAAWAADDGNVDPMDEVVTTAPSAEDAELAAALEKTDSVQVAENTATPQNETGTAAEATAGESVEPAPIPDTPRKVTGKRTTVVDIAHNGADPTGARLAFRLKEAFNSSSLFVLSAKDEPKLKLVLTTKDEFAGRAGLSSIYSVSWTYTTGGGTLPALIDAQLGTVSADKVEQVVTTVLSKTDMMATEYSYLFE